MFAYRTPSVYFEWLDRLRPITRARTDIAGFVGIARRGPLHKALKVASWPQFVSTYGDVTEQGYLGYAVRGFFDNGGLECWIVRCADPITAQPAVFTVYADKDEQIPLFSLEASSPGTWGRALTITMTHIARTSFNLTVRLQVGTTEIRQTWNGLPLDDCDELIQRIDTDDNPNRRDENSVPLYEEDGWRATRLIRATAPRMVFDAEPERYRGSCCLPQNWATIRGRLVGGADGLLTIVPKHLTGEGQPPNSLYGLAVLEHIREIGIVAIPDIMHRIATPRKERAAPPRDCTSENPDDKAERYIRLQPNRFVVAGRQEEDPAPVFSEVEIETMQMAVIRHCELLKNRFAILDSLPTIDPRSSTAEIDNLVQWRNKFDSKYAALYFPWLQVPTPNASLVQIPPCGHVAGTYAHADVTVGVHRAPANFDMSDVKDAVTRVGDGLHGLLNDVNINVIRASTGSGIRTMGARTLSSDPLWRYVNVRRLITMIEVSIFESTQWIVFEPNNPSLWRHIERIGRAFLDELWRFGMLDGSTEEEAFTVVCDGTTNPPDQTAKGWLWCEVKVQPPYPAEFIVVRIGKTDGGTEIME